MTDQDKGIGGFPSNVHLNQVQDPSVGECYLMYKVQSSNSSSLRTSVLPQFKMDDILLII